MSRLDAALRYWERGWSVIPIKPETKRPHIKWEEYQHRHPTEEEIIEWFERWPLADVALVTGQVSGVYVVDCDSAEAVTAADEARMASPVRVRTRKGEHRYFCVPGDGVRRGPRVGANVRSYDPDWPRVSGLDFRGDGSYALLPPSTGYSWEIPYGLDPDDAPVWDDSWRPKLPPPEPTGFSFETLDLSRVEALQPDEFLTEWDRTAAFVKEKFPTTHKIPSGLGNARNDRLMRHISDSVMDGLFGDDLRLSGYAFMREFFADPLPEPEFQATCRSIEDAERRNHPERFDSEGNYIPRRPKSEVHEETRPAQARKLLTMADAEDLVDKAKGREFLIEPWLPPSTIVQVYGYSGHGKSLFLQHALTALASGRRNFGPFEIYRPGKVLYCDWENGASTLGRRLIELRSTHGDAGERLHIWTPFVGGGEMNLRKAEGLKELQGWIEDIKPDVVVLDTVRSAYPGMKENDAQEWAVVNKLAGQIRNAGMACVMVHHANKPGDSGIGREAGSSNQLTMLETQIRVASVVEDKDHAKMIGGVYDGEHEHPVWPMLRKKCPEGFRLFMVSEIRYGKVRDPSDEHDDVQWIGYAAHDETDERIVVASRSSKQRAKDMAILGMDPKTIATKLSRPLSVIRRWLEIET